MEIPKMATNIIEMLSTQYKKFIENECIDMKQIINICNLYKVPKKKCTVPVGDIEIVSPDFRKLTKGGKYTLSDVLSSAEFKKKYDFFVSVMFSCLKIQIDIFDINGDIAVMKNNYRLIKSLEAMKKKMIDKHCTVLKHQSKNISQQVGPEYIDFFNEQINIIKIIDRILYSINKLINASVLHKTDNLFSLLLPYFYTYTEYIEEYNSVF